MEREARLRTCAAVLPWLAERKREPYHASAVGPRVPGTLDRDLPKLHALAEAVEQRPLSGLADVRGPQVEVFEPVVGAGRPPPRKRERPGVGDVVPIEYETL